MKADFVAGLTPLMSSVHAVWKQAQSTAGTALLTFIRHYNKPSLRCMWLSKLNKRMTLKINLL